MLQQFSRHAVAALTVIVTTALGGVQIAAGTRLAIVPEVRVNYAISAVIVRPQVGVRVRF